MLAYLLASQLIINVEKGLFGLFLNAALPIKAFLDSLDVFLEFGEGGRRGGREGVVFWWVNAPGGEIVGIDDGLQLFYLHHNIMALHQKLFQAHSSFPSANTEQYFILLLNKISFH